MFLLSFRWVQNWFRRFVGLQVHVSCLSRRSWNLYCERFVSTGRTGSCSVMLVQSRKLRWCESFLITYSSQSVQGLLHFVWNPKIPPRDPSLSHFSAVQIFISVRNIHFICAHLLLTPGLCKFNWNPTRVTGAIYVCRWILLQMRNVSDKSCRENKNRHFVFSKLFFSKNPCRLWDDVGENGRAGEVTDRCLCWR